MLRYVSPATLYSFAILLLSVASSPLYAQEDDSVLRDRFRKGIARAAAKLEYASFRAQSVHTSTDKREHSSGKIDTRKFHVALRGKLGLETGHNESTGTDFFRVRNSSYAFALDRSSDGKRTSLQFVEQLGVDPSIDARIASMEETPRAIVLSAYYLWTDPLFRLVESDSFSIKGAYPITSDGDNLVRVDFEYDADEPARMHKYRVTDGFLVCDPEREWVLTEYGGTHYNFSNKATSVLTAVLECGGTVGEVPIATKVTRTTSKPNGDYHKESVTTVEITDHDVPEEEFFLSYYGLPEPNFDRPWIGTWVWYLLGGVGCFVVGAAIIRRRKADR